jgi:hypothetical protein
VLEEHRQQHCIVSGRRGICPGAAPSAPSPASVRQKQSHGLSARRAVSSRSPPDARAMARRIPGQVRPTNSFSRDARIVPSPLARFCDEASPCARRECEAASHAACCTCAMLRAAGGGL